MCKKYLEIFVFKTINKASVVPVAASREVVCYTRSAIPANQPKFPRDLSQNISKQY